MCPFGTRTTKSHSSGIMHCIFVSNAENMSSEGDAFLHFVTLAEKSTATKREAVLRFVRHTEHALPPTRESPKAAGFEMRSAYDVIVPARVRT
jgi:hypothetical protein